MAVAVARTGFMLAQADISSQRMGIQQTQQPQQPQNAQQQQQHLPPQPRLPDQPKPMALPAVTDEVGLDVSSSGNEVPESSSGASSSFGGHQSRADGKWLRFGSSESTMSTDFSSACSSIVLGDGNDVKDVYTPLSSVEEIGDVSSANVSPTRKRRSDGTLKLIARHPSNISITSQSKDSDRSSTLGIATNLPTAIKRRGRPSKINTLDNEDTSRATPRNGRKSQKPSSPTRVRPRSSIPSKLPADVFASQCIDAAHGSRLDPYALHAGEHELLANLLMSKEVTIYLNIRNAILRLWKQNPLCCVTSDEAAGCAKETRFFGLAKTAYRWLVRNGYINFGCIEMPANASVPKMRKDSKQRTVVVVGAGVSGLTTARQLENLFAQGTEDWTKVGEKPPRVVLLEGRGRIGGRIYSKPLRSQVRGSLPGDLRNTAETGAMIVTGFDHGNPLDTIIRAQLGLRYHLMTDALTIYDCDGKPVDDKRDMLNTELYTDISDRAGEFRAVSNRPETLKGDADLINRCRDPAPDGFAAFRLDSVPSATLKSYQPSARRGRRRNAPPGTEKLTGRSQVIEDTGATQSAWRAAKDMGWKVKDSCLRNQSISLHPIAKANAHPTLGSVMDEAILQYQAIVDLNPQDMRLLNWHHANLEYANAAPVTSLSLSGHDQDTGNEFEGAHSEIVGGYTQVPRGLMNLPTKLDVRFDRIVDSIHYDCGSEEGDEPLVTKVVCTNGEVIIADQVVVTTPLGVLKAGAVDFDPPLPDWKQAAIHRMGFGLLNKVILLYDKPFWDEERDMFGLLNEAERMASIDPVDYERNRGRFYLIWNASKISGRPMLIALMAGHAAHDAETTDTATLLEEVTDRLRGVFGDDKVPQPLEVLVTRWKRDPFTRGTYSFVAPETQPGDYDLMAKPVGNVHFAGEATCGTHPATVHGAFLSGLRAAADVVTAMTGQIEIPTPLVEEPVSTTDDFRLSSMRSNRTASRLSLSQLSDSAASPAHAADTPLGQRGSTSRIAAKQTIPTTSKPLPDMPSQIALTTTSSTPSIPPTPQPSALITTPSTPNPSTTTPLSAFLTTHLGARPVKPPRAGVNPFLLFTKEKWAECKAHCASQTYASAAAGRDAIRQTIGKWWKAADSATREPWVQRSRAAQLDADAARAAWERDVLRWDKEKERLLKEWAGRECEREKKSTREENPVQEIREEKPLQGEVIAGPPRAADAV